MAFSAVTIFHGGPLSDNEPLLLEQPGTLLHHHLKIYVVQILPEICVLATTKTSQWTSAGRAGRNSTSTCPPAPKCCFEYIMTRSLRALRARTSTEAKLLGFLFLLLGYNQTYKLMTSTIHRPLSDNNK